jgi:hypothetical protein
MKREMFVDICKFKYEKILEIFFPNKLPHP